MILVTGGLGFIGSHVVLSLLAHRQEVVIVDNLANASLHTLERLEFISGMYVPFVKLDVRNTPALNKIFEQYSIDTVIHTAGFKSIEESRLKPLEYYNDNVSCIMSLLRAMQRTGVCKLVHLSSLAVYGQSSLELDENTAFGSSFSNPYIKSQQMIEEIIRDTVSIDPEWKVSILRLSNVAGAFDQGILGEVVAPLPKNIVSLALQVAAMQRDSIELQRNASTADGTVIRNFVHVMDVCEAVFASLFWLEQQNGVCEAFNIAGQQASIQELLGVIEEVTETEIKTIESPYVFQELELTGSKSDKANTILGWQTKRSLEQMIQDQWLFYQNDLKSK